MNVVVLGASPKPDRYSNKAIVMLLDHGHKVFPVNPAYRKIGELESYPSVSAISEQVDTVTIYVGPDRIEPLISDIILANPRRVIANPGAESALLKSSVEKSGIEYVEACTLVLLSISRF